MSDRVVEPSDLLPMIDQALLVLGGDMDTREALAMLAWIALHESKRLQHTVQMGGGPARGLCQVEPKTYRDSMAQARSKPGTLGAVVRCHLGLYGYQYLALDNRLTVLEHDPPHGDMGQRNRQMWAFGVARICLWEATSAPLPQPTIVCPVDPETEQSAGMHHRRDFEHACAAYWHRWWCRGCKGTSWEFVQAVDWGYDQGIDPLSYEPIGGRW